MNSTIITVSTDWFSIFATLFAGVLTAAATMLAVVYTNRQTKKQLEQQQQKFERERKEQFQQSKYVVVRPSLLLTTFNNLMDRLIVSNDYNRMLLLSGHDGFDFFDDTKKRMNQTCRMLLIENFSNNDIIDVVLETDTVLQNQDTNQKFQYSTSNSVALIRARESVVIRLTDQKQFETILDMNAKRTPSELSFDCNIIYSTLAKQRITYHYKAVISNDKRIEIKSDGIINVSDCGDTLHITPTFFRNLQDSISSVDRSSYSWEKMAESQIRGMQNAMALYNSNQAQHNDNGISDDTTVK